VPSQPPAIHGQTAPEFVELRRVFAENFTKRGELGASVCIWHHGHVVADLWAGHLDLARKEEWREDTLCTIFSSTKGLVALCFLILADRGEFSYDDALAQYWPEFAAEGKEAISIRTLLNHRAGLLGIDTPFSLETLEQQPQKVVELAAAQPPLWEPGQDQGYHGVTYGIYAAALFEKIAKESLGTFLNREIRERLDADVFLGLPECEESRVCDIFPATTADKVLKILPRLLFSRGTEGRVYRKVLFGGDSARAFRNPKDLGITGVKNFNTARVHKLELPWGNGIGNARGLAKVYAALACGGTLGGVSLVRAESLLPLRDRQSWSGSDRVLCKAQGWSQGFAKEDTEIFSPNTESFGHPGAGGALGWCDPVQEISIGYVPNKMSFYVRSPRARALVKAVYRCINT